MDKDLGMILALCEMADKCLAEAKQIASEQMKATGDKGDVIGEMVFWNFVALVGTTLGNTEAMKRVISRAEDLQGLSRVGGDGGCGGLS